MSEKQEGIERIAALIDRARAVAQEYGVNFVGLVQLEQEDEHGRPITRACVYVVSENGMVSNTMLHVAHFLEQRRGL
jgi:hypothetical protein